MLKALETYDFSEHAKTDGVKMLSVTGSMCASMRSFQ